LIPYFLKRPSHKELNNKISLARAAVSEGRIEFVDPVSIAGDALEVGYLVADIANILSEILNEITPHKYVGTRPPQRSYEEKIRNCELFAFRWESRRFGCELFLKFTLKEDIMWLVSLHPHRAGENE
jgi:hypothetical protein